VRAARSGVYIRGRSNDDVHVVPINVRVYDRQRRVRQSLYTVVNYVGGTLHCSWLGNDRNLDAGHEHTCSAFRRRREREERRKGYVWSGLGLGGRWLGRPAVCCWLLVGCGVQGTSSRGQHSDAINRAGC